MRSLQSAFVVVVVVAVALDHVDDDDDDVDDHYDDHHVDEPVSAGDRCTRDQDERLERPTWPVWFLTPTAHIAGR